MANHYEDSALLTERLIPYDLAIPALEFDSAIHEMLDLRGGEDVCIMGAGDGYSPHILETAGHWGNITPFDLHNIRKRLWPEVTKKQIEEALAASPGQPDDENPLAYLENSQEAQEFDESYKSYATSNVEIIEGDARDAYFINDESIDDTIASFLLTHFDKIGRRRVISEIARITKPDGKAALTTTGRDHRPLTGELIHRAAEKLGVKHGPLINANWPIEIAHEELAAQSKFERVYFCEHRGYIPVRTFQEYGIIINAAASQRDQCYPEPDKTEYKATMLSLIGEVARKHDHRDYFQRGMYILSKQELDAQDMMLRASMLGMKFKQLK
jgi:SAM-dependent methyltransferase